MNPQQQPTAKLPVAATSNPSGQPTVTTVLGQSGQTLPAAKSIPTLPPPPVTPNPPWWFFVITVPAMLGLLFGSGYLYSEYGGAALLLLMVCAFATGIVGYILVNLLRGFYNYMGALESEVPVDAEVERIDITPRAYLQTMALIAWHSLRHPLSVTVIDLASGEVIESGDRAHGETEDSDPNQSAV